MNPHTIAAQESRVKSTPLPQLEDLSIAGMTPFDLHADECIAQAICLLTLLSSAFETADNIGDQPIVTKDGLSADNNLATLRPGIVSRALDGVTTLISLAQHLEDVRTARQMGRK